MLPSIKGIYCEIYKNSYLECRLLVNLTNPPLLLYREELPAEKTSRNYYLQIITHLQSYKAAFCDDRVWALLSVKLGDILKIVSMNVRQQVVILISLCILIYM